MQRTCRAVCAAATAVLVLTAVAEAKPPDVNSEKLRRAVTVDGIVEH
jgi:hypothetical protein